MRMAKEEALHNLVKRKLEYSFQFPLSDNTQDQYGFLSAKLPGGL